MQNNFEVEYRGKTVQVQYQNGTSPNEFIFSVALPEGPKKIYCKKDNEGAYRWLSEDGSISDDNKELGETIETYLVQHHITL